MSSLVDVVGIASPESSALFSQTMLGLATSLDNVEAIARDGGLELILSSFHVRAHLQRPRHLPHPPPVWHSMRSSRFRLHHFWCVLLLPTHRSTRR